MAEVTFLDGWARPLAIMLTILLVGGTAVFVLSRVIGRIQANTARIDRAERAFCKRIQRLRDSDNRNGAIIYVVLVLSRGSSAKNVRLGNLPQYQPPTSCRRALRMPETYRPPDPIPFRMLPKATLRDVLTAPAPRAP